MTEPDSWSVRNEAASTETGFGSNAEIASATYNALVERARVTGIGGSFSLLKNGLVVGSATVPPRGGPTT